MTSFLRSDRSRAVAIWLLAVAVLVLGMVVLGGSTRLTGSGLSITQWKPLSGVLPPLNTTFVWFAVRREIPERLFWRLGVLFVLGGLQGLVGWWMVASGLADRVTVAPERLMIHLGLAFALLGALVWTALDAWSGWARRTLPSPWGRWALVLVGLIYVQILLGALVAGNQAGLVYNDWPLMGGRLIPQDYAGASLWATLAHSQGAVQLHHRLMAYLLTLAALAVGVGAWRSPYLAQDSKLLAAGVAGAVALQACLGIATLMMSVPIGLGVAHQLMAALTFSLAVAFAWRVRRI